MAQGDMIWFDQATEDIYSTGDHNFKSSDVWKVKLVTNSTGITRDKTNLAPAGFSTASTTGYADQTVGYTGTTRWGEAGNVWTYAAANVTFPQATGSQNVYYAILVNSSDGTAAQNKAVLAVDLGGPVDVSAGDITIKWNSGASAGKLIDISIA